MTEFRVSAGAADLPARRVSELPPVLIGISSAMDRLRRKIIRTAALNGPALITGEPGSGKSLVARALHEQGPRAHNQCAVIACDAFTEISIEAELFGCPEGSIAGVPYPGQGLLERIGGGTVILENIDLLSPRMQASIEGFLASGRVHRIGTPGKGATANTRIVATSTRPAPQADAGGRHHPQLWARLARPTLRVPSLKERQGDVPLLAQFFVESVSGDGRGRVFSGTAMEALASYSWPGNVGQLRRVVERLASERAATGHAEIRPQDLPVGIRPRLRSHPEGRASVGEKLFSQVQTSEESFWSAVYPLFMKREITRADLRSLVRRGLEVTRGDYGGLLPLLNMPLTDERKFISFLRRYGCEVISPEFGAVAGERKSKTFGATIAGDVALFYSRSPK